LQLLKMQNTDTTTYSKQSVAMLAGAEDKQMTTPQPPQLPPLPGLDLAAALERLLTWPNPQGTIEQAYIPGWLRDQCRAALEAQKAEQEQPWFNLLAESRSVAYDEEGYIMQPDLASAVDDVDTLLKSQPQAQKATPEPTDSMGMPLSCGKPLCSPGDHHPLCDLAQKAAAPATRPANSQDWAGMGGDIAFQLIERHADGWGDIKLMMDEWLAANQAAAPELVGLTDEQIDALWQDDELSMPNKIRRRIVASEAIAEFCRINNLPTGTASDGGEG
jgi:hypothetical protein